MLVHSGRLVCERLNETYLELVGKVLQIAIMLDVHAPYFFICLIVLLLLFFACSLLTFMILSVGNNC